MQHDCDISTPFVPVNERGQRIADSFNFIYLWRALKGAERLKNYFSASPVAALTTATVRLFKALQSPYRRERAF